MFKADLHTHTTCSDGTLSPTELVLLAKKDALSALCITDHDTIDAYQEAIAVAKREGIELVSGIELSSNYQGRSVHILGYDFDLESEALRAHCTKQMRRRKSRNLCILKKLAAKNMPIEEKELEGCGRVHIARCMVRKGYVADLKAAFQHYIGDSAPCYDAGEVISPEEVISVIHQAGGKAFLAHPHLLSDGKVLFSLLAMDFDGIECYYSGMRDSECARFLKLAKKRSLLISGGSDFHGGNRPYCSLGCSYVDQETFAKIFSRSLG